jgi:uncharacterized protein
MLYLDSSAIVKLVVPEMETDALVATLRPHRVRLSSALARVEVARALLRGGASDLADRATQILARMELVPVDAEVLSEAVHIGPPGLRALDAIHLATVLLHRDDLDGLVTYDRRLASAARVAGIPVLHPA